MVKGATSLFNYFCSNLSKQVAHFCSTFYLSFRGSNLFFDDHPAMSQVARDQFSGDIWVNSEFTQQDGRKKGRQTLVCDKRDRAISWRVLSDLHLTLIFSGLLQNDLFKGKWSLAKSYLKENYCHSCHTRFAVFFPLLSCCLGYLIIMESGGDAALVPIIPLSQFSLGY